MQPTFPSSECRMMRDSHGSGKADLAHRNGWSDNYAINDLITLELREV